ncbi:hypothetical protein ACFC1V_40645, partial [Streptomyces sp. NPDC056069]
ALPHVHATREGARHRHSSKLITVEHALADHKLHDLGSRACSGSSASAGQRNVTNRASTDYTEALARLGVRDHLQVIDAIAFR